MGRKLFGCRPGAFIGRHQPLKSRQHLRLLIQRPVTAQTGITSLLDVASYGLSVQAQRPCGAADRMALMPAADNLVDVHESLDRKSTRLNSSHVASSYAVFCLKK